MSQPRSPMRPPHPVFTYDPRLADLLNSYQLLYMTGLIDARSVDPVALSDWLAQQSPGFDVAAYSQNLLIKRGLKLHTILLTDPSRPQLMAHGQNWAANEKVRTISFSDLFNRDTNGWFMVIRELGTDNPVNVILFAPHGQGHLAYHPLRGIITVDTSNLSQFDIAVIRAWHLPITQEYRRTS